MSSIFFAAERNHDNQDDIYFESQGSGELGKVGQYGYPNNPFFDRAKGYLLKGKVKNAVTNYGNYITWDEHPAGLWGDFTYLPHVGFVAGVPGGKNSSLYTWPSNIDGLGYPDGCLDVLGTGSNQYKVWCSKEALEGPSDESVLGFFTNGDTNFVAIIFHEKNDRAFYDNDGTGGTIGQYVGSINEITSKNQWGYDFSTNVVFISVGYDEDDEIDPNKSKHAITLAYPWSMRPELRSRLENYDWFDYGYGPGPDGEYGTDDDDDGDEWTEDDSYMYYGATYQESWFSRGSMYYDWQATTKSKGTIFNEQGKAGDIFGGVELGTNAPVTDSNDSYPLLAHSGFKSTWPLEFNELTGNFDPVWPGWFAKDYYGNKPEEWSELGIQNCNGTRKDLDCWIESDSRHISDMDVYMEFDDRWASFGNRVIDGSYEATGYPLGIKVKSMAHSYDVALSEDIMFVTVNVKNESGEYYDEYGNYFQGMTMPDGTKLNGGKGFDYHDMSLGFYMDADVVSTDILGNFGVHTNADDFMEYYWERFPHLGDTLLISIAMIYDYDGVSGAAEDFGIVAVQLLDSPIATREVDLDLDGITDIFPGEKLKMTDWHWFDWYNRPGVVSRESGNNCCAGGGGRSQALNKEQIGYQIIAGDTTNVSSDEHEWFFHTANPDTDYPWELNPHFDSLDGLTEEPVFIEEPEGLDCVLEMSSGPFDLDVGEEVPFSFCIIFGSDKQDLINNARFAQIVYNANYQTFKAPDAPIVVTNPTHKQVEVYWTDNSMTSVDVVSGYSDFAGYKIYRSSDGGNTWGSEEDKIYDSNGDPDGWKPIAQFDLSAELDSSFCVMGFETSGDILSGDFTCVDDIVRGVEISGPDPDAPWYSLGNNSGFEEIDISDRDGFRFKWVDNDVVDGIEYSYSVTAYDIGIRAASLQSTDISGGVIVDTVLVADPLNWQKLGSFPSLENGRGSTIYDANFAKVKPGFNPSSTVQNVQVVPNPYFVHSIYNETEYLRQIRFTNIPENCQIKIYTVTGEFVQVIDHFDLTDGNAVWDLRTINNQEVAPGLYIFTLIDNNTEEKFVGKFAIVR